MPKVTKVIKQPMPVPEEGFKVCYRCFYENPDPSYCVHPLSNFYAAPNDTICKRHYHQMQHKSRQRRAIAAKTATGADAPYGGMARPRGVPEDWVYPARAARLWGVSREWVRQLIERNLVEHMRVNGRTWINPQSYTRTEVQ